MGQKIHFVLLMSALILGVWVIWHFSQQSRFESRSPLKAYENPKALSQDLVQQWTELFQKSSVLFIGVQPENPKQIEIVKELILLLNQPEKRFGVLVVDPLLVAPQLEKANSLSPKGSFEVFLAGVEKALSQGEKILAVVPTTDSAQMVPLNLPMAYQLRTGKEASSLSFADFPRSREAEKNMLYPCAVAGVDQTGLGPLGCFIAQIARGNYKKEHPTGQLLGVLQQVSSTDHLVLVTWEK